MQPELYYILIKLKVAIFQPELRPRTKFALKNCDFCLEKLPRTRRGSNPRPRDSESRHADHAITRQLPKTNSHVATVPADGSSGTSRIRTAPQRECFDHADPRKGFILECEGRARRSEIAKNVKKSSVFYHDHTNLRRGSRAPQKL